MGSNDIPTLYFLDPGFLVFLGIGAAIYGVWWLIERFR